MLVETRERGIVAVGTVRASEQLRGRTGWTTVETIGLIDHAEFVRVELGDGSVVVVTPTHPFTLPDGTVRVAMALSLADYLIVADGYAQVRALTMVGGGRKASVHCEPDHEFWAGEQAPRVLTHNLIVGS